MLIKSKVKYIQSLSHKKLRDSEEVFVAEGPKLINELLSAAGVQVQQLFGLKEWIEEQSPEIQRSVTEITPSELERIVKYVEGHASGGMEDAYWTLMNTTEFLSRH